MPDEAPQSDDEMLMDQCAEEAMRAMEMKDKSAFRSAFNALVSDVLRKLSDEMESP